MDINLVFSSISTLISISAFVVSLFVAVTTWRRSRPKISVTQLHNAAQSVVIKSYDGCQRDYAGGYKGPKLNQPIISSVALAEICITNESSLPVSIIDFKIDGAVAFDSYSFIIDYFKITTNESSSTVIGDENDHINYLKPEFTLPPYTTKRGFLFFWMHNEDSVKPNVDVSLTISTSRGAMEFTIQFNGGSYKSTKKRKHIGHYGEESFLDNI